MRRILLAGLLLMAFPATSAQWGCWVCLNRVPTCHVLGTPCAWSCTQVGDEEMGAGIRCEMVYDPIQGWTCHIDGGACFNVEVDGGEELDCLDICP
ncbi:MAG: hypothetical protein AAF604_01015 [Acidobacteriota bacterium]